MVLFLESPLMRCPECKKFVSYGEPNTDNLEVSLENGSLTLAGELVLPCAECGTDLASASLEAEENILDLFNLKPDEELGETAEDEIADSSLRGADRTAGTDRHGRPIKNPRYAKRYYGVEATVTISRTIRDRDRNAIGEPETAEITLGAEEQASSFESLA
jgi:hypothetical protein